MIVFGALDDGIHHASSFWNIWKAGHEAYLARNVIISNVHVFHTTKIEACIASWLIEIKLDASACNERDFVCSLCRVGISQSKYGDSNRILSRSEFFPYFTNEVEANRGN